MARDSGGQFSAATMADIAFLLLIFFLVATTMDIDTGLYTVMSPLSDQKAPEIKERNVLVVLVNSNDQLMVEGKQIPISMLREKTKEFLINPQNKENLPEKRIKNIDPLGELEVTKGIISLKNDRATSYGMFIKVKNELKAAGNEIKNEFSIKNFRKKYDDLPEHLQSAVRSAVPAVISESEPMHIQK
jgi:biopolymer transport protein ExbD